MKTIKRGNVTVNIEQDDNPEVPTDDVFQITYKAGSRYTLGTEEVSNDEYDAIKAGIESGKYVGMPVYAYVHGDATISTKPYSCQWDSGQSGFVYAPTGTCIAEWGKRNFNKRVETKALKYAEGVVEKFAQYLRGEVYILDVQVDGENVENWWGHYGMEHAEKKAVRVAEEWGIKVAKKILGDEA